MSLAFLLLPHCTRRRLVSLVVVEPQRLRIVQPADVHNGMAAAEEFLFTSPNHEDLVVQVVALEPKLQSGAREHLVRVENTIVRANHSLHSCTLVGRSPCSFLLMPLLVVILLVTCALHSEEDNAFYIGKAEKVHVRRAPKDR